MLLVVVGETLEVVKRSCLFGVTEQVDFEGPVICPEVASGVPGPAYGPKIRVPARMNHFQLFRD